MIKSKISAMAALLPKEIGGNSWRFRDVDLQKEQSNLGCRKFLYLARYCFFFNCGQNSRASKLSERLNARNANRDRICVLTKAG